ncbi:hypothetical protein MMH89_04590 [Candidatus Comchoanobacter bicostacola]|uniref:Uncharacterized protein n=1 Tax=Candidatus Comchoanobacter bicostacola TaxID=2919598 RepID=A0ABY5DIS4_9GAMM|nr:hypothetical protein [Candidatus Comchoanobacter bicostacola]UTC24495.1 hypothetical protein MMH89_04590 [Candidatus Comchoanobacter bicostacola]
MQIKHKKIATGATIGSVTGFIVSGLFYTNLFPILLFLALGVIVGGLTP